MEPKEKKRNSGCMWVFAVMLFLAFCFSVFLNVGLIVSRFRDKHDGVSKTRPADQFPEFRSTWSYGEGSIRVVRIPLQGLILREADGGFLVPRQDPVRSVLQQIRAAQNDSSIKGIMLEVDSPGGAVTPSDEIFTALRAFRESDPERRVVAFSRDLMASGAYYAGVAADWIITEPTCLVGSIGVMIQTLNWHVLTDGLGITDVTIKSGASKDILNPFRESEENELELLQTIIDQLHERFVGIVQDRRGFDLKVIQDIADGRILVANDALDAGLIDQVGYWPDAVKQMAVLLGEDDVQILRYERRTDWSDWFMSLRHPLDLNQVLPSWRGPQVLYLWQP